MTTIGIQRTATAEELKDFNSINHPDNITLFLKKLSTEQQKYQKLHKPYDEACARLDYEREIQRVTREIQTGGNTKESKFNDIDLDKYGEDNWFEFIDETPVTEDKLLDGMRQTVKTGVYRNYKCKARNHGFSIFLSNDDIAAEKPKKVDKADKIEKEKE